MNEPRALDPPVPCRTVLAELPARVLQFLRVIATRAPIRTVMVQGGYSAEDHAEGCKLLGAVYALADVRPNTPAHTNEQAALTEVHQWVTTHFGRLRAAVQRLHPSWVGLFSDVDSRAPAECLLALAHLINELHNGSAALDTALLTTLARRGLHTVELNRLALLVTQAQALTDSNDDEPDLDDRTEELTALYDWYRDWAETAHGLIKRKDHRMWLGIAAKPGAGG